MTRLIIAFVFISLNSVMLIAESHLKKWAAYYGNTLNPTELSPYQLVILQPNPLNDLKELKKRGITTIGYLNVGEIHQSHPLYEKVKKLGLTLGNNPNWQENSYIDIRDERWKAIILDEIIPSLLQQPFDGFFLDTIDSSIYLEQQNPKKYQGMTKAAVDLIKAIRKKYPNKKILVNRGFEILDDVAPDIDLVVGESMYTGYNFTDKTYHLAPKKDNLCNTLILQHMQKKHPHLQVLSLDYWSPEDTKQIKEIYRIQRENGFIPYVTTIDLNQISLEPE